MNNIIESMSKANNKFMMVVSVADLKEFALFIMEEAQAKAIANASKVQDPEEVTEAEWMTAGEVCEYLKISNTTLWRWDNTDYLKPTKICGQRRYLTAEVKRLKNEAQ